MKRQKILVAGLSLTLVALCASLVHFSNNNKVEEAEGYTRTKISTITTIDLNDTSDSVVRNYYSGLNSLSVEERQGTNLLKNLKPILKNNQRYFSYDKDSLWQLYEISDRDWTKSPASDLSGYNSTTNVITGYTYGTSYSNPGTNPYLHSLYINREVDTKVRAWVYDEEGEESPKEPSHGDNKEWYIDQEHIWPKSQGFEASGDGGARGDPMHLWAGDSYVNSALHINNMYGYVDKSQTYTDGFNKYIEVSGNLLGKSLTLGGKQSVFEPQDSDKGDIARAIFYLVARYNFISGEDEDGIDSNNPNLALAQTTEVLAKYTSSDDTQGLMGIMTDLLAWHHADPVDYFEIHRNNLLYTNYTNNRNPFIDFPDWADYIWGTVKYDGRNFQSYNATPLGYANPALDSINNFSGGGSSETIPVKGLSITPNTMTIEIGETGSITPSITPANATDQVVTWTSSNSSIATVNNSGVVTGISNGSALITATSHGDSQYTATCSVTVKENNEGTVTGSVTASNGGFENWKSIGLGTQYSGGGAKFDSTGDNVYRLDIFSGDVATYMNNLKVTITGKINGAPTVGNSYRIDAINGTEDNINVIKSLTKTGSDVFTTSTAEVEFVLEDELEFTTGIRFCYQNKGGGNLGVTEISWEASYKKPETGPEVYKTTTLVFSEMGFEDKTTVNDVTFYNDTTNEETIAGVFTKGDGSNQPKYYVNGTAVRLYSNNKLTITSSKVNLTRIEFTFGSYDGTNVITTDVGTYSDGVWTGLSSSVTYSVSAVSGKTRRISSIIVSYYDAEAYAAEFLSTVTCDNGVTPPSKSAWSTMQTKYSNLFEVDKYTIKNAEASKTGTVVEQMMARYDLIVSKYSSTDYPNFVNRVPNLELPVTSNRALEPNAVFIIIICASTTSLIFVGLLLLLKHKKRRNQ